MATAPIRGTAVALSVLALAGCSNGEDPEAAPTEAAPTETVTAVPTPGAEATATAAPTDPPDETYTVRSGDTLSEIARRFDSTVDAIVEANDLDDPDVIEVGQELVVPAGGG